MEPTFDGYIDAIHAEDRPRVLGSMKRAMVPHRQFSHEYRIELPGGALRWIHARGVGLADETGAFSGMEGTCQDITERRRAEELVRLGEERQELALRGADLGLWDWDVTSGKVVFDARWCSMLGYKADELPPRVETWRELLNPEDAPAVDAVLQPHLRGETSSYETEFRLRHKAGHWRWILARGNAVVRDAGGYALRMAGTHMDVTERKESQHALQSLLREKEALLREVHHRVKNNLQVITSLLRLEAARAGHSDTKDVLFAMKGRIHSMALLHESLYRSGTFAGVDLGSYLRQIATQSIRSLQISSCPVRLELDLMSIKVAMDQAIPCGLLVNELIANCLKHGFPEGWTGFVRVELHRVEGDGRLQLTVSDSGAGLPPDFTARRNGSLGLQLVSDLTRPLEGTLEIGPGPAAVFSVTFAASP